MAESKKRQNPTTPSPGKSTLIEHYCQHYSARPNNLYSLLGLQFEYVMRENSKLVYQALSINSEDVIKMAPYQAKGLQIDLLIETRRYFYIVEMKFQLTPLAMDAVSSMKDKLERFPCPANKSVRTAIIHVNGAQEKVDNSDYIDICCNLSGLLV